MRLTDIHRLQLIATRLLSDLAQFTPISPAVQRHSRIRLLSQRSPELTNAHSQAGEYEREWVDMMPIGDVFIDTMYKAWDNQKNLKRENMSPKYVAVSYHHVYLLTRYADPSFMR